MATYGIQRGSLIAAFNNLLHSSTVSVPISSTCSRALAIPEHGFREHNPWPSPQAKHDDAKPSREFRVFAAHPDPRNHASIRSRVTVAADSVGSHRAIDPSAQRNVCTPRTDLPASTFAAMNRRTNSGTVTTSRTLAACFKK